MTKASGSGAASACKIYINSRQQPVVVAYDTLTSGTIEGGGIFSIGGRNGALQSRAVQIQVADVRVWDRELSAAEIATIYEESSPHETWTLKRSEVFETQDSNGYDHIARARCIKDDSGVDAVVYRAADSHSSLSLNTEWHIRFTGDQGDTWTDEDTTLTGDAVTGFPLAPIGSESPHDAEIFPAANGDWILLVSYFSGARHGTRQFRSTDQGDAWVDEGQISVGALADEINLGGGQALTHDGVSYAVGWIDGTPADNLGPYYTILLRNETSDCDVDSWELHANVTTTGDNTTEPGLAVTEDDQLLVVMRDGASAGDTTERVVSTDASPTLGPLRNISADVGAFHRPTGVKLDASTYAFFGRDDQGSTERTVAYVKRGRDAKWGEKIYLDGLEMGVVDSSPGDAGYTGELLYGDRLIVFSYRGTEAASAMTISELVYTGPLVAEAAAAQTAAPTADEIAAAVELAILDEDDGRAILQGLADKIAEDWVEGDASPLAIVAAMKSDATIAQMISRVDAAVTTRGSQVDLAGLATIVGAIQDVLPAGGRDIAGAGDTAANLDQVSGGGSGATVRPRVVIKSKVWSYDPLRSSSRPSDLVSVRTGATPWLAFEPALNPGTSVTNITSVEIDGSSSGVDNLGPSADYRQGVFQVTTPLTAGTKEVTATLTTSDGQTVPVVGTLVVD